ncbi:hypothetical protein HGB07_01875 [Candidatus Roizmanbacteria bacterium]|nr:hypothetical protein [Candidatus Roizmanbacteria bacterium]
MAKSIGIDTEVTKHKLSGTEASFEDGKQKMNIDITNFNFTYSYDLKSQSSFFDGTALPPQKDIESKAIDVVKSVGRYPDELARGKTNIIYLVYNPLRDDLAVTQNASEANMVEVDFYRPDVSEIPDTIPFVSQNYFNSQNYVVLAYNSSGYKVVRAQIKHYDRSAEQVGVYPLKSGDTAWEELVSGTAFVVSKPATTTNIVIKKMFLGYLDVDTYTDYIQPVYIFLGSDNFVAYVPAIDASYSE